MADEENAAPEEKPPEVPAAPAEAPPKGDEPKRVASSAERLVKTSSLHVEQSVQRLAEASEQAKLLDVKGEKYDKKAREVVGEVIDVRRGSMVDATGAPKVARFLNSYKLEPDNPFNPEKVIKILQEIMIEAFEEFTGFRLDEEGNITTIKYFLPYDAQLCIKQAKWASETIRAKIKELEFDRYKIISIVTIGEKRSQDIFTCTRFLWDFEKDNYTKHTIENPLLYGFALVFGLYYE